MPGGSYSLVCHRVCAPLPNSLPALRWRGEGETPGGSVKMRPAAGGVPFRPLRAIDGPAAAREQAKTATEARKCLIPNWLSGTCLTGERMGQPGAPERLGGKATQSHPKPHPCDIKATPKPHQGYPKATPRLPQSHTKAAATVEGRPVLRSATAEGGESSLDISHPA
jgi:hypothetical protein